MATSSAVGTLRGAPVNSGVAQHSGLQPRGVCTLKSVEVKLHLQLRVAMWAVQSVPHSKEDSATLEMVGVLSRHPPSTAVCRARCRAPLHAHRLPQQPGPRTSAPCRLRDGRLEAGDFLGRTGRWRRGHSASQPWPLATLLHGPRGLRPFRAPRPQTRPPPATSPRHVRLRPALFIGSAGVPEGGGGE